MAAFHFASLVRIRKFDDARFPGKFVRPFSFLIDPLCPWFLCSFDGTGTHTRICLRVEIFLTSCQCKATSDSSAQFLIEFGMISADIADNPELFRMDKERMAQVDRNQQACVALLEELGYDCLLLSLPENFSWFTCGGDSRFQSQLDQSQVALFITRKGRVVLTHDAISPQLFDREIAALGFQLKERNWREPVEDLYDEITRGRSVISDSGVGRTRQMDDRISQMRAHFSPLTEKNWQQLAALATYAVEATCRNMEPNTSEAEIAGEIAHRSMKRGIVPVQIQIFADERLRRYRHWSFGNGVINNKCTINFIARKKGIHFALSRTVSFTTPTQQQRQEYQQAGEVLAETLPLLNSGTTSERIWQELKKICKEKKLGNQWRAAEFAWQLGYRHPEQVFKPRNDQVFSSSTAWYWQTLAGSTMIGHSFLIGKEISQTWGVSDRWPMREFTTPQGESLLLPEILERC